MVARHYLHTMKFFNKKQEKNNTIDEICTYLCMYQEFRTIYPNPRLRDKKTHFFCHMCEKNWTKNASKKIIFPSFF